MITRCCGPEIWRSGRPTTSRWWAVARCPSRCGSSTCSRRWLRRQGKVVPREELYSTVWGAPLRSSDRSVDVYVHKLRAKLARLQPEYRYVHTHFGFGYRLAPELSHPFHTDVPKREQDGLR